MSRPSGYHGEVWEGRYHREDDYHREIKEITEVTPF
jgi:hypothetical protein